MSIYSLPDTIKNIATIIFILGNASFLFAQQPRQEEKSLSGLQIQSRLYRNHGLELQRIGNIEGAMSLYQKAIELDPEYAAAYNDLGIIYEAYGLIERAEDSYLWAVKIDPDYLSTYSNLALLYENQRNLDKAAFYWKKRAGLGSPDDPWTIKAKQRLEDIRLTLAAPQGMQESEEREVISLMKDVASQKNIQRQDDRKFAQLLFDKAKLKYQKGDEVTALKEAIDAKQLDPSNPEIEKFIDKVQTRLLSR